MAANEFELAASLFDEILKSLDAMLSTDSKNQEADSLRRQIQLDQVTLRELQSSNTKGSSGVPGK